MAVQQINNVKIVGISACVPETIMDNSTLELIGNEEEREKFIEATGIKQRHIVSDNICTSDLCLTAAEDVITGLNWNKAEIDCLVMVTQTPDYLLPSTACIIQDRLGLGKDCFAIEISLGCSGWVYGLSTISSLMSSGNFKKGLLLVGDTVTRTKSNMDKSTFPLFGDAGTATAIEFNLNSKPLYFQTGTDGSGYKSIMIKDGGFRNFFSLDSLKMTEVDPGIFRNNLQSSLNGQDVFNFGITKVPYSINKLIESFNISKEEIDYFVFHQANRFMTEFIRKKLKVSPEKVPYSLNKFGNTSSASIPLTIVSELNSRLINPINILASGFGVGLSWATCYFELNSIYCKEVLYYTK